MDSLSQEERMQLALKAFKDGQFKTKKTASLAFDVPETTLRRRTQAKYNTTGWIPIINTGWTW